MSRDIATLEFAWAAGLFEGEGAAFLRRGRPCLQLKMIQESSVRRFCEAVGVGKVYGPYRNRSGEKDGYERSDFWVWVVSGGSAGLLALDLYPFVSTWRRVAFEQFWKPSTRGNAAR